MNSLSEIIATLVIQYIVPLSGDKATAMFDPVDIALLAQALECKKISMHIARKWLNERFEDFNSTEIDDEIKSYFRYADRMYLTSLIT